VWRVRPEHQSLVAHVHQLLRPLRQVLLQQLPRSRTAQAEKARPFLVGNHCKEEEIEEIKKRSSLYF